MNYQKKYLKYKTKYLKLREKKYGGVDNSDGRNRASRLSNIADIKLKIEQQEKIHKDIEYINLLQNIKEIEKKNTSEDASDLIFLRERASQMENPGNSNYKDLDDEKIDELLSNRIQEETEILNEIEEIWCSLNPHITRNDGCRRNLNFK